MYQAQGKKGNPYLAQKVLTASPEELIVYVYDYGVKACAQNDAKGAHKALSILINSLNFDVKELSITFYNVYRHMQHLINRKQFDQAKKMFMELRQTWTTAFNIN